MNFREISARTLQFSAVLLTIAPLLSAEAQDVDVPANVTMHDSTDAATGNILKEGVPFLHNFGTNNTFLGSGAGNLSMTGSENTGTGYNALASNTAGYRNTATGPQALELNIHGSENTATGYQTLRNNTTGGLNTATGMQALYSNTVGYWNTATGAQALYYNTNGFWNTATGWQALANNISGSFNTAAGTGALISNTTGGENTATGSQVLANNTTGGGNTATGNLVLVANTTGSWNTASGYHALWYNVTGSYNTAIGYGADVSTGNLTNATAIGAHAIANANDKIRLGDTNVTVIEGQVPYTYTSDRNQKEKFRAVDAEAVLTKLRGLSVTSWNYKGQDAKEFRHYGPVAQDFFAAFGHDAVGTIGTPTTITSGDLDGILTVAAQALEKRTVEQRKEIDALRVENADLKARLEALERRVSSQVSAEASFGF